MARPPRTHGLEPAYRTHRVWRERYDRDQDPRVYPPPRRVRRRFVYEKLPTDYRWESPIATDYMMQLVNRHCTGARREYMLNVYRHGFPDHYRGPTGISAIRPNHLEPGDPGTEAVDDYVRTAVAKRAGLVSPLPLFPGTITVPVAIVRKKIPGRPDKLRMVLDGSVGNEDRTGISSWTASEDTRFTSDTTLMRLASLVAYVIAYGNLEDYTKAFRSLRNCVWDVPRNCIYWRGRFVYFGTFGFGKNVTPGNWEGHADLLQREQTRLIRAYENTLRAAAPAVAAEVGLGPSGRTPQVILNRIVDDTLVGVPGHYTKDQNAEIMRLFRSVCLSAGQELQIDKTRIYEPIVAFDGFLIDLDPKSQRAGVPEDKCIAITALLDLALGNTLTKPEGLTLIGKLEHIIGVVSTMAALVPAFRVCVAALTNGRHVRLSKEARADLRRWRELLNRQTNGGALWTSFSTLFLTKPPPRSTSNGRQRRP